MRFIAGAAEQLNPETYRASEREGIKHNKLLSVFNSPSGLPFGVKYFISYVFKCAQNTSYMLGLRGKRDTM